MSSVPREAESEAKAEWRTQATRVRPGDRADARSHSTPFAGVPNFVPVRPSSSRSVHKMDVSAGIHRH
jgi:hypothetical protein